MAREIKTSYQKYLDRRDEERNKIKTVSAERQLMKQASEQLNEYHRLDESTRISLRADGRMLGLSDELIYKVFDKAETGQTALTPTQEKHYTALDAAMGIERTPYPRDSMDDIDGAMGLDKNPEFTRVFKPEGNSLFIP